jgi:MEMO1 family protein
MKKYYIVFNSIVVLLIILFSCSNNIQVNNSGRSLRPLRDTIGFAQYSWQMDSLMSRMRRTGWHKNPGSPWKLVICPHDDYTYVGSLYPELLQNIKAPNLIIIGVAHKAAQLRIEDSLVFDSYTDWKGPFKNVPVSPARNEIYKLLAGRYAILSDTLQKVEHSIEAIIPYLQYFNRNITIIPILVPAMNPVRMEECGKALADAIRTIAKNHKWEWGSDYAIVVTSDAVHYGNEDWGGADHAYFGCDEHGNMKAREHEAGIIDSCFEGIVTLEKIRLFSSLTLNAKNFHEYKWTWCGRYCVPTALYTSYYLNDDSSLSGELVGYSTSITSVHIPVDDIGMGHTAIATNCHWVGYAAIGYTSTDEKNMGLATLSVINLRKEPDHASELVSQAILGTPFLVLKRSDSWLQIQTPDNYTGWTQLTSVTLMNRQEIDTWKKSKKVLYVENTGWLYNSASEKSGVVCDLVGGSILKMTGESNGYASLELPDGRKGFVDKHQLIDFDTWKKTVTCTEDGICNMALTYLGLPYLWGGASTKAVDCSGFVQSVFFRNGLFLPRDASLQALHGRPVDISDGFSRLRKGDLLFFGSRENGNSHITHAAIYLGDREYINSAGRVLINSLDSAKSNFNRSRMKSLLEAKRIIGTLNDEEIVSLSRHPWY